eukprot:786541-Pyramimonas_sp.AAC.1
MHAQNNILGLWLQLHSVSIRIFPVPKYNCSKRFDTLSRSIGRATLIIEQSRPGGRYTVGELNITLGCGRNQAKSGHLNDEEVMT